VRGLPKGWREGFDQSLACPHRDVSVCEECASRPEVVEVIGAHYWDPTGEIAEAVALSA
jgi:hypothetical protein